MEWHGTFEIPDTDHRVGGRLVIDGSESRLRLYGSLRPGEHGNFEDTVPLVWGTAETGQQVTLVDLASLGGSLFGPGSTRSESWLCGHAIEGRLQPQQPLTFSAVTCAMTYLSSWLQTPPASTDDRRDGFTVDARTSDLGRVEIDGIAYEFHSSAGISTGFDELTVQHPTWLTATPPEELELEDLVNSHITPIEALLWLATGRFSEISTRVRLDTDRGGIDAQVWSSKLKPRGFDPPTRRLTETEMLFTAGDLPDGFESGIARWLWQWKEIRHAVGPVIARHRAPFSYTNDRLATSVAALEAYSTAKNQWAGLSDEEMEHRKRAISDALSSSTPELVEWTVEAIEGNNRETLRNRLKDLLSATGTFETALLGNAKNRHQFLHEGVQSRNQLSHLLPTGGLSEGASLYWAHRGFTWLLRFHLMIDLGFSADETTERITSSDQFRQEAERIQRDLKSRR